MRSIFIAGPRRLLKTTVIGNANSQESGHRLWGADSAQGPAPWGVNELVSRSEGGHYPPKNPSPPAQAGLPGSEYCPEGGAP